MVNPNVLSLRYAKQQINDIFSERNRALLDRELWIAVMRAQKELGVDIPSESIYKCEKAKEKIDLNRIKEIEKRTRHDVKAKIEAFVEAAGIEGHVHKGMTSRDLTDNVEQLQIKQASKIIFGKSIAILKKLVDKANEYSDIILTARTHHQPAQPTLLGRRFSMWAEELYLHLIDFEKFIEDYPLRGIKGPVGTQFDMLTLLGSEEKVQKLEQMVAEDLGFSKVLDSPGQVYPRSLDYKLVSNLALLSAACENFALGMRLMSGYELVTEGFKEGQVGSSAMPHKMNTRSSERIWSFAQVLKMYADGGSRISGEQWEEGSVSCSALRRVIIPDSFCTADGLCETTLTVLNEMGAYPVIIGKEVDRYLPFLATTEILTMAVKEGIGREAAHEIIKKHAVAEALKMRQEGTTPYLAKGLSDEPEFKKAGITEERINSILEDRVHFIGRAKEQIDAVTVKTNGLIGNYIEESMYEPGDIL